MDMIINEVQVRVKDSAPRLAGTYVFLHVDERPSMPYNKGKVIVSKQPNSIYIFAIDPKHLEIVE